MKSRLGSAAILSVALCASIASATVQMPAILGDGMVLQSDASVELWGFARRGEAISVEASWGATAKAITDDRGRFSLELATTVAGGPHQVIVQGENRIVIDDVWLGEVWLVAGQSNMEWPLSAADADEAMIAAIAAANIRVFDVPNRFAAAPRLDCEGRWARCDRERAAKASAIGLAMARHLSHELGVPIGIVQADWGGTRIEAWMSETALAAFEELQPELEHLAQVRDPELRRALERDLGEGWWRKLDSLTPPTAGWIAPEFDDQTWNEVELPGVFGGELARFDGLVAYRHAFELDDAAAASAATLLAGRIDDFDDVWINGKLIGGTHELGQWATPRRYAIPAGLLQPGRNVIAIRVLDTGGPGGIAGTPEELALVIGDSKIALAGSWREAAGSAAADLPPRREGAALSQNTPAVLMHGMIQAIAPMTVRGVAWYQGESNRANAPRYRALLEAMIADWRSLWGAPSLPFGIVQIAPYRYAADHGQAAQVREAQAQAAASTGSGLIVTLDHGDIADIHPQSKMAVGQRLAQWALATVYERDNVDATGPRIRHAGAVGGEFRIAFDHAGDGLVLRDDPRGRFLIAGADRRFHSCAARVEGDVLVLSIPAVPAPVAARYAFEVAPAAILFSSTGLPAAPFRTDEWEGELPLTDSSHEMARWRGMDEGLVDLFDGKTLAGWINLNCAPDTWVARAEDGVIACSGVPTGLLRTERMFGDFILELEWRHLVPGGNAGLFVWSDALPAVGSPFLRSVEVQIMDGHEGDSFTSDGDVFPIFGASMIPAGGDKSARAFPTARRTNDSPFWNHYRVECRDGELALAINGAVVTRGHSAIPRRGYICLESEGSPIEFRNIRILELNPDAPLPAPELIATADRGHRMVTIEAARAGIETGGAECELILDWKSDSDERFAIGLSKTLDEENDDLTLMEFGGGEDDSWPGVPGRWNRLEFNVKIEGFSIVVGDRSGEGRAADRNTAALIRALRLMPAKGAVEFMNCYFVARSSR